MVRDGRRIGTRHNYTVEGREIIKTRFSCKFISHNPCKQYHSAGIVDCAVVGETVLALKFSVELPWKGAVIAAKPTTVCSYYLLLLPLPDTALRSQQ
jgi:hypothetical protein